MDTPLLKRGGMRVAGLVDADPGTGGGAILRPPAMRRVIGQRAAAAVDGRAEQRARGVPGPGQIEPEQRDVAGGYGGTSDRRYICASGPGSLDIAPLASQLVTLAGNPAGPVPRLQGRMETRHGGGVRRAPRPGFRRGPGEHLADWRGGDQTGQVPAFLDPAKPDRPAMNTSDRGPAACYSRPPVCPDCRISLQIPEMPPSGPIAALRYQLVAYPGHMSGLPERLIATVG